MSNLVMTVLAGLLATGLMTLSLYACHWQGFANGDMVRALGSVITRKYDNSMIPGLAIHLTSGVIFALFYVFVWSMFPEISGAGVLRHVQLGAFCGLAQGLVISTALVVFVAEHHPLEQFRVAGINVALVHLLAHIVYGATLGGLAGVFHLRM